MNEQRPSKQSFLARFQAWSGASDRTVLNFPESMLAEADDEIERLTAERDRLTESYARETHWARGEIERLREHVAIRTYFISDNARLRAAPQRIVNHPPMPYGHGGGEWVERIAAEALAIQQVETAWLPIDTAPKDGRMLLLGYFNKLGNWRTLRGQWFEEGSMDEWDDGGGCDDNPAGWYETVVENDDPPNCWATEPTHWRALPDPPMRAQETFAGCPACAGAPNTAHVPPCSAAKASACPTCGDPTCNRYHTELR